MRILALGGTRFVGRHIVEAARTAGHDGVRLQPRPDAAALGRRRAPARRSRHGRPGGAARSRVGRVHRRQRVPAAASRAPRRSCSPVTSGTTSSSRPRRSTSSTPPAGWTRRTAVLPAALDEADAAGAELYGARKVACEQEVERAFPGRTLIIRPGIVAGPHDPTNRFTWWVERLARGGEVLAPGSPDAPVQLVDGRDLGAFTVAQTERLATGVFNVCGPPSSFGELIAACRTGTGTQPGGHLGERATAARARRRAVHGDAAVAARRAGEPRVLLHVERPRPRAGTRAAAPRRHGARHLGVAARRARGRLPEPVAGGFVARGLSPEREAALLAAQRRI